MGNFEHFFLDSPWFWYPGTEKKLIMNPDVFLMMDSSSTHLNAFIEYFPTPFDSWRGNNEFIWRRKKELKMMDNACEL